MRLLFLVLLLALFALPAQAVDQILIYKAERQMLLLQNGEVVRQYRIALGRQPVGPKVRVGDLRTPEGSYRIVGRNAGSRYYKSLKLNYPNDNDRLKARKLKLNPGDLIMIHGIEKRLEKYTSWVMAQDWTRGCIAVTNAEMDEIWRLVPVGTPVHILARAPDQPPSPESAPLPPVPAAAPTPPPATSLSTEPGGPGDVGSAAGPLSF